MQRHDFLAEVHAIWKPRVYLEIGVQHGWSLNLAKEADLAIGVDPFPLVNSTGNQIIHKLTSDAYFASTPVSQRAPLDMTFIDGQHLFEYALRDFMNAERHGHQDSIIIFDDVLPRNQEEASRVQCAGDWTGDVWKVHNLLTHYRKDLLVTLVDTQPTGVMVVVNLDPNSKELDSRYEQITGADEAIWTLEVPMNVLERRLAISPDEALSWIREVKQLGADVAGAEPRDETAPPDVYIDHEEQN